MSLPPLAALAAASTLCVLGGALASGCGDAHAQSTIRIEASDLPCADHDPTLDEWESVGWFGTSCSWTEFPRGGTLEIDHPLGRTPKTILIYISFEPTGASATLASGNTGLVLGATDETLTIQNDTRQRFYARVVAR